MYPFLGTKQPDAIPDDYFAPLFARIGSKPIAITETGWPAEATGGATLPWVAGEREQVEYIGRLTALLRGHEVRLANWLLLHPLRDDGSNAQAWFGPP